jgi:hypothetical protein
MGSSKGRILARGRVARRQDFVHLSRLRRLPAVFLMSSCRSRLVGGGISRAVVCIDPIRQARGNGKGLPCVKGGLRSHTYDSLRVPGATRAQAELPQLRLGLVGEGVEAGFGRLCCGVSGISSCRVQVGCGRYHVEVR